LVGFLVVQYSSWNITGDVEAGVAGPSHEGSEITGDTLGEQGWDKSLADENTFEIGRVTPGVGGVRVFCEVSTD
jgi:hypothetical protein